MLYSVIVIAIMAIFMVFEQILFIKVINTRENGEKIEIPVPKTPKKKPKLSKEQQRTINILENIDNYNGSALGQKDVEVK